MTEECEMNHEKYPFRRIVRWRSMRSIGLVFVEKRVMNADGSEMCVSVTGARARKCRGVGDVARLVKKLGSEVAMVSTVLCLSGACK